MPACVSMSGQGGLVSGARHTSGRTAVATAELLGQQAIVFPSHHGGFMDGEFGYAGKPDEFAHRLRQVLDGTS